MSDLKSMCESKSRCFRVDAVAIRVSKLCMFAHSSFMDFAFIFISTNSPFGSFDAMKSRQSTHGSLAAALVSRQFVDMTRIRIEGLLAAFPKLVGAGKQHTYVETENVRYVYQPIEVPFPSSIACMHAKQFSTIQTKLHTSATVISICSSLLLLIPAIAHCTLSF